MNTPHPIRSAFPPLFGMLLTIGSLIQSAALSPAQRPAAVRSTPVEIVATADQKRLVAAVNAFARDLQNQMTSTASAKNTVTSPASVAMALLMLLPGARGETADEIAETLRLPTDLRGDRLSEAARLLLVRTARTGSGGFGEGENPNVRITNDIWCQQGHDFEADYLKTLRHDFYAHARAVDFEHETETVRQRINQRIKGATNGRIAEFVPRGMIQSSTRAVLSNAIWYRGRWVHDFYQPKSHEPFYVTPERKIDGPVMHTQADFFYAESAEWQAIQLPMKDRAMAFEIVLPRAGKSLTTAENALLTGEHLRRRAARLVHLTMPPFQIDGRHRIRQALEALGIRSAFDPKRADFSGITKDTPPVLDDLLHGTWLNVDDKGVEAAAATVAVLASGAAIREEPIRMAANRPFAFAIRDRRTDLLLFVGRLENPRPNAE
ncbi:MAG: serpin family protein [bacterium]|nr:serpin family protein [bacterium]